MLTPAKILVLEDDDDLRGVLAEVLEDEGYLVTAVSHGEAAVTSATENAFDLIIADIRMEGMDGLEAIEKTQQLQPGIGSLIVSGYATEQETARAERLKVGAYLSKPFKTGELLEHVHHELGARRKESEADRTTLQYRQMLDWSFTSLARMADDSGLLPGSVGTASQTAERLARHLGLAPEVCYQIRWATTLKALARVPEFEPPQVFGEARRHFPVVAELLFREESEPAPERTSRELECVELALARHLEGEDKDSMARFSEEIRRALARLEQDAGTAQPASLELRLGLRQPARRERSLVSLGRALERLGDRQNAHKAFLALTREEVSAEEKLEGYLGLARLALLEKRNDIAEKACKEALSLAYSHGPTSFSIAGLECALWLERSGSGEALPALRKLAEVLDNMGRPSRRALVELALCSAENRAPAEGILGPLAAPGPVEELHRYADWLIEFVLRTSHRYPEWNLAPVLCKMSCDYPSRFLYWFEPSRCSEKQRLQAARDLEAANYLPEQIVGALEGDPTPELRQAGARLRSRLEGRQPAAVLQVRSFGLLEVASQGEPVAEAAWKTRKVKYLFALLASRWGRPLTEDHIIDDFWPQDRQRNKKNLYWATTSLRRLLKNLCPQMDSPLVRAHDSLYLDPEIPRWHDLEQFEEHSGEALRMEEKGEVEMALARYRLAAGSYRGPYLEGCYFDWALEIRDRLAESAFNVYHRLSALCLERQLLDEAGEYAQAALSLQPQRQDAAALLMRALIRRGLGSQAIETFQQLEGQLRLEYELEPATELLELYHRARLGMTDA